MNKKTFLILKLIDCDDKSPSRVVTFTDETPV